MRLHEINWLRINDALGLKEDALLKSFKLFHVLSNTGGRKTTVSKHNAYNCWSNPWKNAENVCK